MSLFYRIMYGIGFTPWEEAARHPAAAKIIAALFDREQDERSSDAKVPFGKALDLGCGRGFWSVDLARRGWQVTGVDIVPGAIKTACESARQAGVDVRFLQGDITALRAAGVDESFNFFWDFGTVHGLASEQRKAVGREVTAIAAPAATLLMLAWAPANRGPLPHGASRADIEAVFPSWKVVDVVPLDATGLPRPLRKVDPRLYRLILRP